MLLAIAPLALLAVATSAAIEPAPAARPDTLSADLEPGRAARTWTSIVLHHSATRGGSVEAIDAAHRRQKDARGESWLGIGYHFVIGNGQQMGDGELQPTFRWRQQLAGAHAGRREHNEHGIGICLIGNFDQSAPTARQLQTARRLVDALSARFDIAPRNVLRHADVAATACPGRHFSLEDVVAARPRAGRPL
jgi:hypothetical protein